MGSLVPSVAVIAAVVLAGCSAPDDTAGAENCGETEASGVTHVHGLAVSPANGSVLFVATHHGLFKLYDDERFVRVGNVGWDFMGFTLHPENDQVAWSSGHAPPARPNIGVAKTEDGGCTWRVVALDGLVDFHALAVSPADPERLFGNFGRVYLSTNGGERWETVGGSPSVYGFAPHPTEPERVWAATREALLESTDGGRTWGPTEIAGLVTGVAFARADPDLAFAFVATGDGLVRTMDGGGSWETLSVSLRGGEAALHFAPDPQDASVVYLGTSESRLFKTEDGGDSWFQVPKS